ncbi:MAG: hypothetical protein IID06_00715 [Gemmatimonadetes bacterium]|nr:hypothetical protein [Gemmatimonadota bacterium]
MTLTEMLRIFLVPYGWPFLLYVVLQVYLPLRARGTKRFWWSLLPLLGSVPVLWLTYNLGRQESNLWPLFLIFGGVAFAVYETLLLLLPLVWSKGDTSRRKD